MHPCVLYSRSVPLTFVSWCHSTFLRQGLLRDRKLDIATQVVLLNGYGVLFPLALSVSTAATIRVGTLLGARIPLLAQRAAYATLKLAVGLSCLVGTALGLGRGYWPLMFGVTQPVFDYINGIGPLFASVVVSSDAVMTSTTLLGLTNLRSMEMACVAQLNHGREDRVEG